MPSEARSMRFYGQQMYVLKVIDDTPYFVDSEWWFETSLKDLLEWMDESADWIWDHSQLSLSLHTIGEKELVMIANTWDAERSFDLIDLSAYDELPGELPDHLSHCPQCLIFFPKEVTACEMCQTICISHY